MQTIQTHKGELIVVSVHTNATNFRLFAANYNVFLGFDENAETHVGYPPLDRFSIIGTCANGELDFDCEPYVYSRKSKYQKWYRDYKMWALTTSLNLSFLSLLTSQKVEYANTKLVFLKREK